MKLRGLVPLMVATTIALTACGVVDDQEESTTGESVVEYVEREGLPETIMYSRPNFDAGEFRVDPGWDEVEAFGRNGRLRADPPDAGPLRSGSRTARPA